MTEDKHEDHDVAAAAWRALGQAVRGNEAPARVEHALMTEFRRRESQRRRSRNWWRLLAPVAAAVVVLIVALTLTRQPEVSVEAPAVAARELTTDYIPVGFGMPVGTSEFTQVIRISVPRSEMTQFGLPAFSGGGADRVQADVVLGEDGVARAIRFVH